MAKKKPRALTFDVFGTVVDWRSPIVREGEILTRSRKAPELDWVRFANSWRAGYPLAMDRVRKGEIPWTNLDGLHREILVNLLPEFAIHGFSDADLDHLNRVWHRLDAWPDAVEGVARLRRKYIVATLSNGNMSLLVELSRHAGFTWDCILSAELARHYKPDREVYEMAVQYLGLAPGEVMMVAAHPSDLRAAQSVGFQTAYVHRPTEKTGDASGHFDVTAKDLLDLADKLG